MCTSASNRLRGLGLLGALATTVAGCAVGPDFKPAGPPKMDRYSMAAPRAAAAGPGVELGVSTDPRWWSQFGSPALDDLVTAGLKNSPTLASARDSLRQSENQARAGAGVFYPSLGVTADVARERFSPARFGQAGRPSTFSLYTAYGEISYALDIFGGERRTVEALQAEAEGRRYAVGAAYLLLTGDIVDAAIAHAAYADEAAALKRIVELEAAQKSVLTAEAQAGHASWSLVLAAEQQLALDRESLAVVGQQQAAAATLMSLLLGREPAQAAPAAPAFRDLRLPVQTPVSLPSQLVHRRPDILQAEAAMRQANAEVGVATAALFPSISLTGQYGAESLSAAALGAPAARFWNAGPTINVPIFQGGALWFSRRAAQAASLKAQDDYRQTVLAALKQVADLLQALDADGEATAASQGALDAGVANQALAEANLQGGVIADFDAMTIEIAASRARLQQISAKAQELQDIVALNVASGGGWNGQETGEAPAGRPAP